MEAQQRQRRVRAPKAVEADNPQELHNADLARWNTQYLANMAEATRVKEQYKAPAQAKKNAAFWVCEQGLGGVGIGLGQDRVPGPLQMFSGRALLEALTGRETSPARSKRTRSSSGEAAQDEEARRVRARVDEEEQVGRGEEDEGGLMLGDDEELLLRQDDMVSGDYSSIYLKTRAYFYPD